MIVDQTDQTEKWRQPKSQTNDMNDPLHYTLRRMWERKTNFHKVFDHHIEILIYEVGQQHEELLRSLTPDE